MGLGCDSLVHTHTVVSVDIVGGTAAYACRGKVGVCDSEWSISKASEEHSSGCRTPFRNVLGKNSPRKSEQANACICSVYDPLSKLD